MLVRQWRAQARDALLKAGSPDPEADAKLLSWGDALRELDARELEHLEALLARRLKGEPVQYVLHSAWFMGLEFFVDARVLIPRQDTEALCEAALERLRRPGEARVLDLCAGSGALGLSIARLRPGARVTLSDLSEDACAVAAINRDRLGVEAQILCGDLFAPVQGRFDLIVCNPPYVRAGQIDALQAEVRKEPRMALDGGVDGLDFYRRIAAEYRSYLAPGGTLALEIGWDQAAPVRALLGGGEIVRDLCGRDRAIVFQEEDHGTKSGRTGENPGAA